MRETVKSILEKDEYQLEKVGNCVRILFRSDLKLANFALVTNITTNDIIYNPHCDGLGGTVNTTGDLIFEKTLTSEMKDGDTLMVIIQENQQFRGGSKNDIPVFTEHLLDYLDGIKTELGLIRLHQQEADDIYFTPNDLN